MSAPPERDLQAGGRRAVRPAAADAAADAPAQDGAAARPAPPAAAPPRDAGESPLRSALSVVTTLGPPLTIVTALLVYFGWARGAEQARYMGLDVSLFGFSTQDYVLQSISTLYVPLLAMAGLVLGWLALHRRVERALARPAARPRLWTAGRVALAAGLLAIAAAVLAALANRDAAPLVLPLVVAAGTAVAAYGGWLAGAARGPDAALAAVPPWQRALRALLVGSLITLALFWELSSFAGVVGRGQALGIASRLASLPRATAFSASPLGIQAPGVREQRLDVGPDAGRDALRYRTTGLRLLVRSGGRLFLLHDGWTPQRGTVVVLPDNDQVRWQFSRG